MVNLVGISFHESTVIKFYKLGLSIFLDLQGVGINGVDQDIKLEFRNVHEFFEDGVRSGQVNMLFPDGEILTLRQAGSQIDFIIEWNDFESHNSIVKPYRIIAESIVIVP